MTSDPAVSSDDRDNALRKAREAGARFAAARGGPGEVDTALEYAHALDDLDKAADRHMWEVAAAAFEDYQPPDATAAPAG